MSEGKIMDRDYRITADSQGFEGIERDRLADFPIEKARFRSVWYMVVLSTITIIGYGWSLHARIVRMRFVWFQSAYGNLVCCRASCATIHYWGCDNSHIQCKLLQDAFRLHADY